MDDTSVVYKKYGTVEGAKCFDIIYTVNINTELMWGYQFYIIK